MRISVYLSVLLLIFGCVEDSEPGSDSVADTAVGSDSTSTDGTLDDGGSVGDGFMTDMDSTDGGRLEPDTSVRTVVNDCPSACERITDCGRQDVFASTAACMSACDRVSEEAVPENWFDCLELEGCGLLQLCRLPEPRPMTCEEVCAELDSCGQETNFDCLAVCAEHNGDNAFSECGEFLYGGVCGTEGFWSCVGETIFPDCAQRCDVGVECNVLRANGCLQSCIAQLSSEDALEALRTRQSNQCLRLAGDDCRRIDECVNPQANVNGNPPTREEFCGAWNRCFADFFPCDFLWDEVPDRENTTLCVMEQLRNGCPQDPGVVFEQCLDENPAPVGPGCTDLCEAQFTCGLLGEGVDQFTCVRECSQVLEGASEDAVQRLRIQFPCGLSNRCDELAECLEANDPISSCETYCEGLDGCGLADDGCVDLCDRRFFRSRDTAHRACVAEAVDCDEMAACEVPVQLDCARLCERGVECGFDRAECESGCDNDLFDRPDDTLTFIACVMGAPTCTGPAPSLNTCQLDPRPGLACARYCSALNECAADRPAEMTDCLMACGDGYVGAESVRFAAAETCLVNAAEDAACAALQACIPDPVSADCAGWCGALSACQEGPDQCVATCGDDLLSQVRTFQHAECLAEDLECVELGDCIGQGGEVEALEVSQDAFCEGWNACGFQQFAPCQDFYDERMPEDMRRCLVNEIQICPNDPFVIIELCEQGQGSAPNAGGFTACAELCEADALCAVEAGGQSIRECTAECYETLVSGADEDILRLQGFLRCRQAKSCIDLAACRSVNSPEEACGNFCDSLTGCGIEREDCAVTCDSGFYRSRNEAERRCVLDAGDDCVAMAECGRSTSPPCDYMCERIRECGRADPNCAAECDDDHFEDPAVFSRQFACAVTAPRCTGLPPNALRACGGDEAAGADCWSFCWAQTGCDVTQGAALGQCLIACGEGYIGDEALVFHDSISCMNQVDPELDEAALCAAFVECIPESASSGCGPWCGELDACQEDAACVEACDQDPLNRLRSLEQTGCVVEADGDCDAISACSESASPQVAPVPDLNLVCQQYSACGFDNFIPCDQIIGFAPDRDAVLRCMATNLNPCPPDPAVLFNNCLQGPGLQVPAADYGPVCHRFCQSQGMCDADHGSIRECIGVCIGRLVGARDELQPELVDCRDALNCADLEVCTSAAFGEVCNVPCAQYLDCGGDGFEDLATCREACNRNRQHPRARPNYVEGITECLTELIDHDGEDGNECAEAGLECFDPERRGPGPSSCAELCPLLAQCGLIPNDGGCVQGCEQADRDDPVGNAQVRQCIGDALDNGQCDGNLLERCFEQAGPPRP